MIASWTVFGFLAWSSAVSILIPEKSYKYIGYNLQYNYKGYKLKYQALQNLYVKWK